MRPQSQPPQRARSQWSLTPRRRREATGRQGRVQQPRERTPSL